MTPLTQRIVFDINNSQAITALDAVENRFNELKKGIGGINLSLTGLGSGISSSLSAIASKIASIVSAGISLQKGFNYNKEIEDSTVGMAGVLTSMTTLNGKALEFGQSLRFANQIVKDLTEESLKTTSSASELLAVYRSIMSSGMTMNISLKDLEKFTVTATAAVKTLAIPPQQLIQEIRDLLTPGGITVAGSQLSTSLGITNQELKKIKENGTDAFKYLMERMEGFRIAQEYSINTFSGLTNRLSAGFSRMLGEGLSPLFDYSKQVLKEINDKIVTIDQSTGKMTINPSLISGLKQISNMLVDISEVIKGIISSLSTVIPSLSTLLPTLFGGWAGAKAASILSFFMSLSGKVKDAGGAVKVFSSLLTGNWIGVAAITIGSLAGYFYSLSKNIGVASEELKKFNQEGAKTPNKTLPEKIEESNTIINSSQKRLDELVNKRTEIEKILQKMPNDEKSKEVVKQQYQYIIKTEELNKLNKEISELTRQIKIATTSKELKQTNKDLASEIARKYDIDTALFMSLIETESSWNTSAISPRKAKGLTQITPDTAKTYNLDYNRLSEPLYGLESGAKILKSLLDKYDGDVKLTLAAYNAGESAVKKSGNKVPNYSATQNYIDKILNEIYPKYKGYQSTNINELEIKFKKDKEKEISDTQQVLDLERLKTQEKIKQQEITNTEKQTPNDLEKRIALEKELGEIKIKQLEIESAKNKNNINLQSKEANGIQQQILEEQKIRIRLETEEKINDIRKNRRILTDEDIRTTKRKEEDLNNQITLAEKEYEISSKDNESLKEYIEKKKIYLLEIAKLKEQEATKRLESPIEKERVDAQQDLLDIKQDVNNKLILLQNEYEEKSVRNMGEYNDKIRQLNRTAFQLSQEDLIDSFEQREISFDEYLKRLNILREKTLQNEIDIINAGSESPDIKTKMIESLQKQTNSKNMSEDRQLLESRHPLIQLQKEWSDIDRRIEDTWSEMIRGMSDVLINFVNTGKLNFKDLAKSAVNSLLKIQIEGGLSNLLSYFTKWFAGNMGSKGTSSNMGSKGTSSASSVPSSLNQGVNLVTPTAHTGGIIGKEFGQGIVLPTYHSGGIVKQNKLKEDEVLTILQVGEEVLTRKDIRHSLNIKPIVSNAHRIDTGSNEKVSNLTKNNNTSLNFSPSIQIDARGSGFDVDQKIKKAMSDTLSSARNLMIDDLRRGGKIYAAINGR